MSSHRRRAEPAGGGVGGWYRCPGSSGWLRRFLVRCLAAVASVFHQDRHSGLLHDQRPLPVCFLRSSIATFVRLQAGHPSRPTFTRRKIKKIHLKSPRNRHGTCTLFFRRHPPAHAHVLLRMSKSSTATASRTSTQLSSKSAWAKGPPQTTAPAPSPRSASPAPNQGPPQPTHSRRPSTLGQGVSFKDGARSPTNTAKSGV